MTESEEPQPPANEDPTMPANALKAMAHPLRWKILCTLGDRELSVGEIVEQTGTSQSNISQHLEQLRNPFLQIYSRRGSGNPTASFLYLINLSSCVRTCSGFSSSKTVRFEATMTQAQCGEVSSKPSQGVS